MNQECQHTNANIIIKGKNGEIFYHTIMDGETDYIMDCESYLKLSNMMCLVCHHCHHSQWYDNYEEAPEYVLWRFKQVREAFKKAWERSQCKHAHIDKICIDENVTHTIYLKKNGYVAKRQKESDWSDYIKGICADCGERISYDTTQPLPEKIEMIIRMVKK